MKLRRPGIGTVPIIVVVVAMVVVATAGVLGIIGQQNLNTVGLTYSINGLTCHVPAAYQSYPSVIHLLPMVTTNPRFLNLTYGMPFVFGNAENITDRTQQIGNQPPVHLPDALEMVFYSTGPSTCCGVLLGGSETTIDVQVPIQNGAYNMTGAAFNGPPG